MTRADLLVKLVKFGISGDKRSLCKITKTIIVEERQKEHTVLANKLEKLLPSRDPKTKERTIPVWTEALAKLLHKCVPQKRVQDLILPEEVKHIYQEIVEEHQRIDLLHSYNIEPRNRLLFIGPPGNGKTSLVEALADSLESPLYLLRYDGAIGSCLGETAHRVQSVIDYASTHKCVLFFDEFETLGKERSDPHETGEIKRVVSSLLLQIDRLPSHVMVIGATNHPELLDRAAWRRFQVRIILPEPTIPYLEEWLECFQQRRDINFGYTSKTLANKLHGLNFSEVEEFGNTVFRKYILGQPEADMKTISSQTLKQWATRGQYNVNTMAEVSKC